MLYVALLCLCTLTDAALNKVQPLSLPNARRPREIKEKNGAKCANQHILCRFWAKQGHCYKKKSFMEKQCKAACDPDCYCLDKGQWEEPLNCTDQVPYCEYWASQGACTLYRDYMLWKCQKACDPRCKPQFKFTIESLKTTTDVDQ